MVRDAEEAGKIQPGVTTLVEATSGNTGVGLAMVAAVRGYRLVVVMNSASSNEKRALIRSFGAELAMSDSAKGHHAHWDRAKEIASCIPNSYVLNQVGTLFRASFVHYSTTTTTLHQPMVTLRGFSPRTRPTHKSTTRPPGPRYGNRREGRWTRLCSELGPVAH
jgi:cysteine synthase